MIINSTTLFMASDHRLEKKDSRTETLRIWIDAPAAAFAAGTVTLSVQAKEAAAPSPDDIVSRNPKLLLIKKLIEAMAGKKIRLLTSADLQTAAREEGEVYRPAPEAAPAGPERAGWGIRYDYTESHFALKDDDNNTRGQIRRTGLYLTESGRAGSVQQLDVAV